MSEYGRKLIKHLKTGNTPDESDFFVGIVRDFVDKDSNLLSELTQSKDYSEYIDNRNVVYVTPIHSELDNVTPAIFLNSHKIDVPIIGEAVFCVKTGMGNLVIDQFSIHQFGLNYDVYDFLFDIYLEDGELNIEYPEEYADKIKKQGVKKVTPFFPKIGSQNWLGRNNQYLIFDNGSRHDAEDEEHEKTKNSANIKLGFREEGEQVDSREDQFVVITRDGSLNQLMTKDYKSKDKLEDEPNDGIGVQSDQVVMIGSRFVVMYSMKDLLIEAKEKLIMRANKIFGESEEVVFKSGDIKLGSEQAGQSFVKGEELISLLKKIISLIESSTYLVTGSSAVPDPSYLSKLKTFKATKLNNNSNILSRKIKGE